MARVPDLRMLSGIVTSTYDDLCIDSCSQWNSSSVLPRYVPLTFTDISRATLVRAYRRTQRSVRATAYSGTINGLDASECGAIGVNRVHGTDGATSAPPAERLSA